MALLVLSAADVERCVNLRQLTDALDRAFRDVAAGRVEMPVRTSFPVSRGPGRYFVMPAYLPESDALTTKIAAAFPNNPSQGLPLILGVVLLSDSLTGAPLAIMDAGAI